MHLLKRLAATVLMSGMILGAVGCGSAESASTTQTETQAQTETTTNEETATSEGVRTIVDQVGNEVVLPEKIERVVITSLWPLPSVYTLFQGSAEGLVGMHPAAKAAAEGSMLSKVADLSTVETGFIQDGQINAEELMKLNPDLVLYNGANTEEYEILKKAGIPAVGFLANASGDWNTIESISSWMELLGTIYQKEDRAAEIKEMGYDVLEEIQATVSDIPEEEKERVLILYRYSDEQMTVSGSGHFGNFWIEAVGGINAAADVEGSPAVNMEQIYTWNPDKIFITNFSSAMPEDLINNTVDGDDWSSVKAVQDGEVYKIPLGMYRWYPPSSDTPLMLKWMAQKVYPEKFADVDMNTEVKEYYKEFYGIELTDEDVTTIFNPSREAANGV